MSKFKFTQYDDAKLFRIIFLFFKFFATFFQSLKIMFISLFSRFEGFLFFQ